MLFFKFADETAEEKRRFHYAESDAFFMRNENENRFLRILLAQTADTTSANIQTLALTIDRQTDALHVRRPNAVGFTIGVAYIMPTHRTFST